jgi:hypothetical protein
MIFEVLLTRQQGSGQARGWLVVGIHATDPQKVSSWELVRCARQDPVCVPDLAMFQDPGP